MNKIYPLLLSLLAFSCKHQPSTPPPPQPPQAPYSVTPAFVKMIQEFQGVEVFPLISSEDVLPESPNFIYGGQPDGAGIIAAQDGKGYLMITTHEANRSVSRIYLDSNFKPMKGEYIVDFTGGVDRLCSATLATPEIHGFGPIFLAGGESNIESRILAVSPFANVSEKGIPNKGLPALGRRKAENALPLPKEVYPNQMAIFVTEDDANGQMYLYTSSSMGDLSNGTLHVLRRKDLNPIETNIVMGQDYEVEFVPILADVRQMSGVRLDSISRWGLQAINFARLEDVDYGKGSLENNRNLYFTATGVSMGGTTPYNDKTMWGRVYQLTLDENTPLQGKLRLIVDGDNDVIYPKGLGIINPDNICVTEHYAYIQEDGDSYYANAAHDSYIWQYNLTSKVLKPFLSMHHQRDNLDFSKKYNVVGNNRLGSWEFGAMYDVSKESGMEGAFLVNIHSHTWQNNKFINPDGGGSGSAEGGQTVLLKGVPK
ncbi:MAG: hypothetical protein ACKVTZ_06685 [Bacteroidia bacterium]